MDYIMLDNIDTLVSKLAASTYTYQMAKNDARKGANKRVAHAKQQIHDAVMEYANLYIATHSITAAKIVVPEQKEH